MLNNFLSSAQRFVEEQKKKIQPVVQKASAFVQPALQKIKSSFQQPSQPYQQPASIQSFVQKLPQKLPIVPSQPSFLGSAQRAISNVGETVKKYTTPVMNALSNFATYQPPQGSSIGGEFGKTLQKFPDTTVTLPSLGKIPNPLSTMGPPGNLGIKAIPFLLFCPRGR
mgnify:FL=1